MKVLLVEDELLNAELARDLLEVEGHVVLHAGTAEDGLLLVRQELPDLVVMDIALPGMNGLEAVRKLKADPATRHICVVALTAYAMKGDAEQALRLGCDAYLTKPIDTRTFSRQLEELVARRHLS